MLFLVISTPRPDRPEDIAASRQDFRSWIGRLTKDAKVRSFHPRVGRGAVVIFDVAETEELHSLLTQWSNIVPAQHDIYPLLEN